MATLDFHFFLCRSPFEPLDEPFSDAWPVECGIVSPREHHRRLHRQSEFSLDAAFLVEDRRPVGIEGAEFLYHVCATPGLGDAKIGRSLFERLRSAGQGRNRHNKILTWPAEFALR